MKITKNEAGNYYTEFPANIVLEYSSTPKPVNVGRFPCSLELFMHPDLDGGCIEWDIENYDTVGIGLEIEGNKILGYDGVFELPAEVQEFLTLCGYDLSEL